MKRHISKVNDLALYPMDGTLYSISSDKSLLIMNIGKTEGTFCIEGNLIRLLIR